MAEAYQLIVAASGRVIVPRLRLATTFWQRFRGLQFCSPLAADEGLLLLPCRSIHTHWMRFSIDVAMIDRNGLVLKIRPAVSPWCAVAGPPGTRAIVETPAGRIATLAAAGDRLVVTSSDASSRILEPFFAR